MTSTIHGNSDYDSDFESECICDHCKNQIIDDLELDDGCNENIKKNKLIIDELIINEPNFKNIETLNFNMQNYEKNIEKYHDSALFICEYYQNIGDNNKINDCNLLFKKKSKYNYTYEGIIFICEFYNKNKDYINVIWFTEMLYSYYKSYNLDDIYFLIFYCIKYDLIKKLKFYYTLLILKIPKNHNNTTLLFGHINGKLKDTKNVEKYYKMHNSAKSFYKLAIYYYNNIVVNELKNILIECIDLKYYDVLFFRLIDQFDFKYKIKLIQKLKLHENLPQNICEKINETEITDKNIQQYKNKVRVFTELKNIKECIICKEEKLNIILNCGHEICQECYLCVDKCYYNCT
jgi:hypothetical protein